jgi:hypothetical protein
MAIQFLNPNCYGNMALNPVNYREAIFANFIELRIPTTDADANLIQFYRKQRTFSQKEYADDQ